MATYLTAVTNQAEGERVVRRDRQCGGCLARHNACSRQEHPAPANHLRPHAIESLLFPLPTLEQLAQRGKASNRRQRGVVQAILTVSNSRYFATCSSQETDSPSP